MRSGSTTSKSSWRAGYATLPTVTAIAMIMTLAILFVFRANIRSRDVQARSQVKIDFAQREEALLRALLYLVPNKAIGTMQRNSQANATSYQWETIFNEAIALANAGVAIDAATLASFGIEGIISANTGDTSLAGAADIMSPAVGSSGFVNPGNVLELPLLFHPELGPGLPAPLRSGAISLGDDRTYPLVSPAKVHDPAWTEGVHLSVASHPLYNLLDYPEIMFGYGRPGERFVAKRNWWAFAVTFGKEYESFTGVPALKKNYVISIYEVPSQLPLEAIESMNVGRHDDGTTWQSTDVTGGVFAGRLSSEGGLDLTDGLFSGRHSLDLSADSAVDGVYLNQDFNALGTREQIQASSGEDFYEASLAGNTGRMVFVPLNRGIEFLQLGDDGNPSERISPTGWNAYSTGPGQVAMMLEVEAMESAANQTPTQIRFHYRTTGGVTTSLTYTRDSDWPRDNEAGGNVFPFQTDFLPVGRKALILFPERLPAFLASLGDAADVTVNHSIYIYPNDTDPSVNTPSAPTTSQDPAVAVREGADLSAFTSGFSLVTNLRLYIAESFNLVPIPLPANSGLPSGTIFYPPVSLFAVEQRFGDGLFDPEIDFKGQIGGLSADENLVFSPLDLRTGSADQYHTSLITAELSSLRSPAELPPVHRVNWLVTIEEIHDSPADIE